MSLRDDSIIRDERGRIVKGSPGLHRKPDQDAQSDQQSDTPPFDGDFDDAIIYVAETYQGKPRTFGGLLAVAEDLRRAKPVDYASYLRQAYANRKTKQDAISTGSAGVTVIQIGMIPSDHYVSGETMRALVNGELQIDAPVEPYEPEPPPTKPTVVHPTPEPSAAFDQPALGAFLTQAEIDAMSEAEIAAGIKSGKILFVGDDE